MRSRKLEAIVIKRVNLFDSDRIVTVFSKNFGKMKIKAPGVRKISSRRGPHIELLNKSLLFVYEGKKLPILTEASTIHSFPKIKKDLRRSGLAFHICELVNELCAEHQENRQVFYLLEKTLRRLEEEDNFKDIIYEFELSLLTLLGFWPPKKKLSSDNTQFVIEEILEKRLKTKKILPLLA